MENRHFKCRRYYFFGIVGPSEHCLVEKISHFLQPLLKAHSPSLLQIIPHHAVHVEDFICFALLDTFDTPSEHCLVEKISHSLLAAIVSSFPIIVADHSPSCRCKKPMARRSGHQPESTNKNVEGQRQRSCLETVPT